MDDLIRRAREALVDVTPGPWEAALEKGCHGVVASIQDEVRCVAIIGNAPETPEREPMRFANARFIAAARDLVPAMADRIEAQEALLKEAMAAMEDARQSLVDSAEEIVELRLTLSKTDLELPWLSDAIDKQTIALAKLRAHLEDKE